MKIISNTKCYSFEEIEKSLRNYRGSKCESESITKARKVWNSLCYPFSCLTDVHIVYTRRGGDATIKFWDSVPSIAFDSILLHPSYCKSLNAFTFMPTAVKDVPVYMCNEKEIEMVMSDRPAALCEEETIYGKHSIDVEKLQVWANWCKRLLAAYEMINARMEMEKDELMEKLKAIEGMQQDLQVATWFNICRDNVKCKIEVRKNNTITKEYRLRKSETRTRAEIESLFADI